MRTFIQKSFRINGDGHAKAGKPIVDSSAEGTFPCIPLQHPASVSDTARTVGRTSWAGIGGGHE